MSTKNGEGEKKKMRVEQKSRVKKGVGRMLFVAVSIVLQIVWFMVLVMKLSSYATWISVLASLIAFVFALRMFYRKTTGAIKLSWIVVILVFPILGITMYLLLGRPDGTKKKRKHTKRSIGKKTNIDLLKNDKSIEKNTEKI